MFVAASGAVRRWQDHRFVSAAHAAVASPFPLKELPGRLGDWRLLHGSESTLDPRIARVAGCSDHVARTYVHTVTGVQVNALVLYGDAEAVSGHTPEICYPSAGYRLVDGPDVRDVVIDGRPAPFRSLVFAKEGAETGRREEVYYAFLHDGNWFVDRERYWKIFRHRPSLYKVQVQRRVLPQERLDKENPTADFLAALLPALERRITGAGGKVQPAQGL